MWGEGVYERQGESVSEGGVREELVQAHVECRDVEAVLELQQSQREARVSCVSSCRASKRSLTALRMIHSTTRANRIV